MPAACPSRQSCREAWRGSGRAERVGVVATLMLLLLVTACGSWSQTFGPSGSSQTLASWDGSKDQVSLVADRRSTASGCTTTWFDWKVASGHYDARAVRDCDSDSGATQDIDHSWLDLSRVTDFQKIAVGTSGLEPPTVTSTSNCRKYPGSTSIETFAPFSDTMCIGWQRRESTGSVTTNSGGAPDDCDN